MKKTKILPAVMINLIIQAQKLSQADAARHLKINQSKISSLTHYRLEHFSVKQLMNFLTTLDRDIEISVDLKPPSRKDARILITIV
jgi:predicted XRE-type DNA-binding protein